MLTSSAKGKGRRLQQQTCKDIIGILAPYGIEPDDVTSRGMGQNGVDCIFSPQARRLLDLDIENKNVEKLNVVGEFNDHYRKYENKPSLKLLIHARNRQQTLVTMRWADLLQLLKEKVDAKTK